MKKYIFIQNASETLERINSGKHVKGSLFKDETTGELTFKPYTTDNSVQNNLIKKLPWGWVKETMERIQVHGSFPKRLGADGIIAQLEENTRAAKDALTSKYLNENTTTDEQQ